MPWLLTDMACVPAAMAAAFALRFGLLGGAAPVGGLGYHLFRALAFAPVFAVLWAVLGVYSVPKADTAGALVRLLAGNTLGLMLYVDAVFLFRDVDFSRWMLFIWFILLNGLTGLRSALSGRAAVRMARPLRVLVVGGGPAAVECSRRLSACGGEYELLGVVPAGDNLPELLRRTRPDRAVVVPGREVPDPGKALRDCERSGAQPWLLPEWYGCLGGRAYIEPMAGLAAVNLRRIALDDPGAAVLKRLGDVLGAAVLLVLASPVMLAAAVGTALTSPGPVIFTQERLGRDREPFIMYKFRTMAAGTDTQGWTVADDPRRTRFGAFLRRWSIDELPQLYNVLRGDMSLVGPRPEVERFAEQFCRSVPLYMVRHRVRPGITGWAQIHGLRGDTSIPRRAEYDLWYIENWSPLLDGKILLLTPFRGIVNRQERPIRRRTGRRKEYPPPIGRQ